MRFLLTPWIALLASCSTPNEREQDRLMAFIENRVELPKNASPLNAYARYYAKDGHGRIVGVYTNLPGLPKNEFYDVQIGHRKWVDDYRALPMIFEGGCGVVSFKFNPQTQKFETPACNLDA